MATYSDQALAQLTAGFDEVAGKVRELSTATIERRYKTQDGRLHGLQGFMRRITLIYHCINNVYAAIPPDTEDIPVSSTRNHVLVMLHSFSMNTFGALDNLAWIWCCEREIDINKHHVGLGPKNIAVRSTLPQGILDYLSGLEDWFVNLYGFRHDIAHRIPFYIPPYIIDGGSIEKYNELEMQKISSVSAGDIDRYWQLDGEQAKLGKFKAVVAQGPVNSRLYFFHPNMLADFATIHEIALRLIRALDD